MSQRCDLGKKSTVKSGHFKDFRAHLRVDRHFQALSSIFKHSRNFQVDLCDGFVARNCKNSQVDISADGAI